MAKNPFIQTKGKEVKFIDTPKSAGILDDFAVRKVVNTKEAYIDKLYSGEPGNKVWLYADIQTYSSSQRISTEKIFGANTMRTDLYNGGIYFYNNGAIKGSIYVDITGDPTKILIYGNLKLYDHTSSGVGVSAFLKVDNTGVVSVDNNAYLSSESDTLQDVASRGNSYTDDNLTLLGITIDGVTLDTNEWVYLDGQDQAVLTTSSPEFANLIITSTGDIKPSADAVNAINIAKNDGTNFINFDTTNSALYVGGLTSAPASGAKFMIVDTANMTLRGVTQATAAMTLGSQASAGSSYVNRLHHFDNNKGNARTEVTFSNSGDSTTDATGNAIWQNNFVSFMIHGARFAANNYMTSGVTGKTSDAGYAYLLAQGGYVTALGILTYNNVPLYLGANNTAILKIDGSNVTVTEAKNFVFGTTTGTKIGTGTTQKLAFYNSTPIVKPSAYTQTYATASKTHSNLTSAAAAGTATSAGYGFVSAAEFNTAISNITAIRTDLENLKQVVNSVIDDLQALGLVA